MREAERQLKAIANALGRTATNTARTTSRFMAVSAVLTLVIMGTALAAPPVPQLQSPPDGAHVKTKRPTFSWSSTAGPNGSYTLEYSKSSGFPHGQTITRTDILNTSYTPTSDLTSDGVWYWHVEAIDSAGNHSDYQVTPFSFTLDTQAPGVPTLESPADDSYIADATPLLEWNAAAGADTYTLQYSTSPTFVGATTITGIVGTNRQLPELAQAEWYWHVKAVDQATNESAYSDAWSFTVDTQAPGVPTLKSPANNSYTNDATPLLEWNAASGADTYTLQYSKSSTFEGPSTVTVTDISGLSYPTPSLTQDKWYWRVKAVDEAANESAYSETWSFTVDTTPPSKPALKSPANNSNVADATPLVEWNTATGAYTYTLQYSTSPTFSGATPVTGISATSYELPTLAQGKWYWRVKAVDEATNESAYSDAWSFTVDTEPPAKPTLKSPANNSYTNDPTPLLEWNAAMGADTYTLQYSTSPTFVGATTVTGIETTSYQLPASAEAKWYWHVKAVDEAANESAYSDAWSFTIDTTPPAKPTLKSPANNSYTNDATPSVEWNTAEGANTYTLQYSTQPTFAGATTVPGIEATSHQLPTLPQDRWYWRVKAVDLAMNESSYSDSWSFTVDTEAPELTCYHVIDSNDVGRCDARVVFKLQASDNFGVKTVTSDPPEDDPFLVGVTSVTSIATDSAGNTDQCSFNVTVKDTTKPVFTYFPPDVTVPYAGGWDPSKTGGYATASDNCQVDSLNYSDAVVQQGICLAMKPIDRTWKAFDHAVPPNVLARTQRINRTNTPPTKPTGPTEIDCIVNANCTFTVCATDADRNLDSIAAGGRGMSSSTWVNDRSKGCATFNWIAKVEQNTKRWEIECTPVDSCAIAGPKTTVVINVMPPDSCVRPIIDTLVTERRAWVGSTFDQFSTANYAHDPDNNTPLKWLQTGTAPIKVKVSPDSSETGPFSVSVNSPYLSSEFRDSVYFKCHDTKNCYSIDRSKIRFTQYKASSSNTNFGTVLVGHPDTLEFSILPDVVGITPSFAPSKAETRVTPKSGNNYYAIWTPKKTGKYGELSDTLQKPGSIEITATGVKGKYTLNLDGSAVMLKVTPSPALVKDTLDFKYVNSVDLRAARDTSITVKAEGNIAGAAKGCAATNSADFEVVNCPTGGIIPGQSLTVKVRAHPQSDGSKTGNLRLRWEVSASGTYKDSLSINLSAIGQTPSCAYKPDTTVTFPNTDTGSCRTKWVRLKNTSSVPSVIDDITVVQTEEAFSLNCDTPCALTIPPGGQDISLTFCPDRPVLYRAELVVKDSVPDVSCGSLRLAGLGVLKEWQPDTRDSLGAVSVCDSIESVRSFTIRYFRNDSLAIIDSMVPDHRDWLHFEPSLSSLVGDTVQPLGNISIGKYWVVPQYKGSPNPDSVFRMNLFYHIEHSLDKKAFEFDFTKAWGCAGLLDPIAARDFGVIELGSQSEKTFTLRNGGDCPLIVSGLRIEPQDSVFAITSQPTLPLTIQPGQVHNVVVEYSPTGVGANAGQLVITHSGYATPWIPGRDCFTSRLATVLLAGSGKDSHPPRIDTTRIENAGRTVVVSVTDVGSWDTDSVGAWWRLGNAARDDSVGRSLEPSKVQGDSLWFTPGGDLTDENLRRYGYEIRLRAADNSGNDTATSWISVAGRFASATVQITNRDWLELNGSDGRDSGWHLVSIPGNLETYRVSSIFEELSQFPDASIAPEGVWRLVRLDRNDPEGEGDVLHTEDDVVRPGEGYWFRYIDKDMPGEGFTLKLPAGRTIRTDVPYTMTLQKGWNLIGNPFFFPVWLPWKDLDADLLNSLYFQKSPAQPGGTDWWERLSYRFDPLDPWKGYVVYSEGNASLVLDPHYRPGDTLGLSPSAGWSLTLVLKSLDQVVGQVTIGLDEACNDGPDPADLRPLPFFTTPPKMVLTSDEFGAFVRDIRNSAVFQEWQLDMNLDEGRNLTLVWEGESLCKRGESVLLRDIVADRVINMAERSSYEITNPSQLPPGRFRIYFGSSDEVKEASDTPASTMPITYRLYQNYPNPFNPSTSIAFDLPWAQQVRLDIYNVTGSKVTSLVNDYLSSGSHIVTWNGRDGNGKSVASGIYFARLAVGGFKATIKLSLVK